MAEKKKTTAFVVNSPNGLNLRDAPNGGYMAILPHGAPVKVSETSGAWSKVTYMRQTGWVKTEFLSKEAV